VDWTFVYLMLVLKIPIVALFWIVWWAVRADPNAEAEAPEEGDGGGGSKRPRTPTDPRPRRRGPHGDPRPPAPPRARPVAARGRRLSGRQRSGS
jgi:hypothetical protein